MSLMEEITQVDLYCCSKETILQYLFVIIIDDNENVEA